MSAKQPPKACKHCGNEIDCDLSRGRLLCRKEAARYLGVAPQTLAAWACSGRYALPCIKIGHRVFYRMEDLEAFIERYRITSMRVKK